MSICLKGLKIKKNKDITIKSKEENSPESGSISLGLFFFFKMTNKKVFTVIQVSFKIILKGKSS